MNLIDTHAHIYLQEFAADREKILENAAAEGISRILMPAVDQGTHDSMLALENGTTRLAMMGLHPCSVNTRSDMDFREELDIVRQWLEKRKFIAVGEIGLDFYWDKTWINEQYEAFRIQIRWALEFGIPIVIHSRDSIDACIEVVKENQDGKLRGVFHCFSGNIEQAKKITDLGFCMGIGGVVTFKNSGLDKVLPHIPIENIVLETDAPYLSPVPFRGKRNEPVYLKYIVEKISVLKEISMEEVSEITTQNANNLFALKDNSGEEGHS
jgi:TatD DNase family protein